MVRHVATQLTIKEEKSSRVKFTPMVAARDALTVDPGMVRKKLTKVATTIVAEDDSEDRFAAMVSSERQTGALHLVEEEAAAQWASAVGSLTPSGLKFALNACQDSLPHNCNLAIWKGHPSECKLCGERQSLLHVLCSCPELRRYNDRHDQVLRVIFRDHLPSDNSIIADLPDQLPFTFPPHRASTDLRPDIVVWNDSTRFVALLELTVCHESNFVDACHRKQIRYLDLEEDIPNSSGLQRLHRPQKF